MSTRSLVVRRKNSSTSKFRHLCSPLSVRDGIAVCDSHHRQTGEHCRLYRDGVHCYSTEARSPGLVYPGDADYPTDSYYADRKNA